MRKVRSILGICAVLFWRDVEQRRKAWGTCAVEKGLFTLGEGLRNLEDVYSEEDEASP